MSSFTLQECRLPTGELVFRGLASEQSLESFGHWGSEAASFVLAFVLLLSTVWIVGG